MTDDINSLIQQYGSITGIISGIAALITLLARKLYCKGKDDTILVGRITLLESGITTIQERLQSLEKKTADIDESIHAMREAGLEVIGEVKESMARLEEAYKNLPKRQG